MTLKNRYRSLSGDSLKQVKFLKTVFIIFSFLNLPSASYQKRLSRDLGVCYNSEGNPQHCQPDFQNIALKKKIQVSETCGVLEPEEICRIIYRDGRIERTCETCQSDGVHSHPSAFLTDINDMGNITYWQSKSFESRGRRNRVTLIISFEKAFELSYISLQFYSPRPAAMAIYKSMDRRRTWKPYQFYAKSCKERFGLRHKPAANETNEQEALCIESYSSPLPLSGGRVIFNPTRGRPSESSFESSHVLQDWVTATDIKVVLLGVNDVQRILPLLGYDKRRSISARNVQRSGKKSSSFLSTSIRPRNARVPIGGPSSEQRWTPTSRLRKGPRRSAPSNGGYGSTPTKVQRYDFRVTPFYAINDITIGGRCKCNGHASTCSVKDGRLVCDCKHNTEGVNCERCKAFHFDRPWKRATRTNPNECVACNCNLHARKCRFNADLYEKSGGNSGGVCQKCRHHTTGRFCHICMPGYYRNPKISSIAHRKVCRTCGCHPVGSAGKICDSVTGQCPCKDGVAGKRCNRCAKGYEQTQSRVAPCIKSIPKISHAQQPCVVCKNSAGIQLSVSKWCKFGHVFEAEVVEMVTLGQMYRITLKIIRIYRMTGVTLSKGLLDVQVREQYIRCQCLKIRKGRKFLFLTKKDQPGSETEMNINKNTVALRWRHTYKRKLINLIRKARATNTC